MRRRLVQFLAGHAGQPQVVIKDPRSVWTQALWKEAAAEVGLDIRYISMLRHPAEVVGSRTTYYARGDEGKLREYATFNVARWMNTSLISERETRGDRRSSPARPPGHPCHAAYEIVAGPIAEFTVSNDLCPRSQHKASSTATCFNAGSVSRGMPGDERNSTK